MKNKYALLLALFVTLLISFNYWYGTQTATTRETVIIVRVLDGDTVELDDGRTVRLININTPEKGETGATEAKDFLSRLINRTVEVEITGIERYGRSLGRVYSPEYVNLELIQHGLGHIFLVEKKEIVVFRNAQEEARQTQQGIWKRSSYYGCLNAEIDKNKEYLAITHECTITLVGWSLKDETTHPYMIATLAPQQFIVYSGSGNETAQERYWGRGNVWNNDRDSLFVRDTSGNLVYFYSYGY